MRDEDSVYLKLYYVFYNDLLANSYKVSLFRNRGVYMGDKEVLTVRALTSVQPHLHAWLRAQRQRARGEKTS